MAACAGALAGPHTQPPHTLVLERRNQQGEDFLTSTAGATVVGVRHSFFHRILISQAWNLRTFEAEAGLQGQKPEQTGR